MHWQCCLIARTAPNAETVECTGEIVFDEIARAASDADAIRCTGDCLIVRLLHPTVKRPDARWRLSVAKVR